MKSINCSNQEYGRFSLIPLIFLAAIIPLTWLLRWERESAVAYINQVSFGLFSTKNFDSETTLFASLADQSVNNTDMASTVIGSGTMPFITLNPNCAYSGESFTVHGYDWPYNGDEDTSIYWETVGGTLLGIVLDSTVTAGNGVWTKTVSVPISATFGIHTVVADRTGTGSAQASAVIGVPCPTPDLTIRPNVTLLSPAPINQGDPVSFRVIVTNTGVVPTVNLFFVSLYFNPSPAPISSSTHISSAFKVASAASSGLAVGSSQVVTLTAVSGFPITGTNTVYGVVDSDPPPVGQINETNETNNISNVLNVNVEAPEFTNYFPAVFGKP